MSACTRCGHEAKDHSQPDGPAPCLLCDCVDFEEHDVLPSPAAPDCGGERDEQIAQARAVVASAPNTIGGRALAYVLQDRARLERELKEARRRIDDKTAVVRELLAGESATRERTAQLAAALEKLSHISRAEYSNGKPETLGETLTRVRLIARNALAAIAPAPKAEGS